MKPKIWIFILAFSIGTLSAQDKAGKIVVMGKVKNDKIYLRWAADNTYVLEQGLKNGFVVHRKTILIRSFVQDYPRSSELASPYLPKPMEQWESHIDDDHFAIAAQALYGESFEVGYAGNPFMQAAQKEQDRNQRLGFLLFACDQNFAVAEFSGLAAIDSTAQKHEKYLYAIYIRDTSGLLNIDTGYCFIGLDDAPEVPVMDDVLQAKFSEHQVSLRWNIHFLKNYYSSYVVERSENGKTFEPLNEKPLVLLENPNSNPNEMIFIDSLQQEGKTYHYRIRGKDAFGDWSEPSNVVQGKSQKALEVNPELLKLNVETGKLKVSWTIDPTSEKEVAYFEIRSREDRFGEDVVLISKIASKKREVDIPKPSKTCYITIVAFGEDGSEKTSLPLLFQEEDNTPPIAPVGVNATIDTNGVVALQWVANREEDLSGYRLFRANQATAEFTQISAREIKDTVFFDTVSMNTTSAIFYKVMAVDLRGNQSPLSAACEAKRPILFAPTAPAIINYRLDGQNLFLKWANSSDEQVTHVQILMQSTGTDSSAGADFSAGADLQSVPSNWTILNTLPKTGNYDSTMLPLPTSHTEPRTPNPIKIALRSSTPSQHSPLSNPISLTVLPAPPPVPELYTKLDREQKTVTLNWVIKANEPLKRIQILRNETGEQAVALKHLSGNEPGYSDTTIEEGKTYEYRILIETESGSKSFSKKNRVKF